MIGGIRQMLGCGVVAGVRNLDVRRPKSRPLSRYSPKRPLWCGRIWLRPSLRRGSETRTVFAS